jgi:hypothetical protein
VLPLLTMEPPKMVGLVSGQLYVARMAHPGDFIVYVVPFGRKSAAHQVRSRSVPFGKSKTL